MTIWVASVGTAAAEWLHLSDPQRFPTWVTAFLILSALAAAAIVAIVARHAAERAAVLAELVEALHSPLGWPEPTHGLITASRWKPAPRAVRRAHRIYPNKIRMHYIPAAAVKQQSSLARMYRSSTEDESAPTAEANPEWLRLINSLLTENLGVAYKLSVDRRARRLTATPDPQAGEDDEPAAIKRLRAKVASPAMFEAGAVVTDYTMSEKGRITKFTVTHNISEKLARSSARTHQIERIMSKILAGRWRAEFNLVDDIAEFELRPSLPRLVWPRIYPENDGVAAAIANYKHTRFIYAFDEDRNPISWHPKTVPHRLIIGPTGSGKTSTIHTFVTQAARAHWAVNIVDRKNIEYRGFRDWPNVQCVATRIEDQIALIYRMWMLMKQRYEAGESGAARTEDFAPVLLVLDEFTELVKDIAAWYVKLRATPGLDTKKWPRELPIEEMVGSILRLGRTARIHVIIGMQRPDVKYVEGENRDNLTGRQSVGRLGRNGADMLWGDYYTGTTIPPGLLGRGVAYNDHGDPVEVQNFFTPDPYKPDDLTDPTAKRVLKALRPASFSHPRIVFATPFDPHQDEEFHYTDYLEAPVFLAEERPDLDPLSDQYRFKPHVGQGEAFAAAAALGPDRSGSTATVAPPITASSRRQRDTSSDRWPGYGAPAPRAVDDLQVGDLICVDAGLGVWGILEKPPEPDVVDPTAMLLSWRGADDEYDLLTVPADDPIVSRALLDDDQQEAA
ncbi:FtsK/SpoIIIE domain-containing protein [Mycobacterium hubeiense]|uniref:FtsK/SpoIIIE domain-containing protein n=1 Tax=Mycobacterium hubeiense TaxID=1867256 RepID=UPI0011586DD3|nr:FtsK/SpoIIIE domain-containing protein [Mycobacterium sp. QGD 101]